MTALTIRQRLEFRGARLLSLLPPRTQIRLSGRPPVRLDGQALDPEIQLLLSVIERRGRPPYEQLSLEAAREDMRRGSLVGSGPAPPVAAVHDLMVDGADGPLHARHYAPPEPGGPHPLLVYYHGGGFVLGDLDSHDVPCRMLARHAGVHVLAVDYRLAPGHRFPAAVDDAEASLRWAFENCERLGADPARVAVGGDSAGGNIAAVVAWQRSRSEGQRPALQLLIYPATDMTSRSRSHELFDQGFLLIREDMDWFAREYIGGADRDDPRLSILLADDLGAAPPAIVVTAGFDPLRDEGEAYAARLREAGVPVVARRFEGQVHGFLSMIGLSRTARDALVETAGAVRAMLSRT